MNKFLFFQLFLLCLLISSGVSANNTQQTISLNGDWNFRADYYTVGEQQQWFSSDLNDTGWDRMPVPGNWDIRNEYAQYTGKAWYRTSFETPRNAGSKVVRLMFEAVGIDYKVWLNGELVSDVTGGYFPNYINIGTKLKSGQKNVLAVCVDNTFRSGAYWSWGGIRRPVQLVVNNPVFIESTHIVAIPDLICGTAAIAVRAEIQNPNAFTKNGVLEYELLFDGKTIRSGKQNIQFTGSQTHKAEFAIALAKKDVKLWHFDFPHLYSLKIRLLTDNNPMHELSERFGIRKVEIRDKKFLLNGEEIRAMGLNWVADNRLTGNTLPEDDFKREIDNMKMLGVNLSRLSHVPLTKDIYDYLDEKGMMIIAEVPLWGITNLADPVNPVPFTWLKKLVNGNFNHPSIVGWCVGNEIGYVKHNPLAMKYVEKSIQYVKDSLDNSRIVVMVTHSAAHQADDPSKYSDFVPLNTYGGWGWELDRVRTFQPDKAVFLTEYGQNLIGEDINTSNPDFGKILKQIRNRDYVFGASLWTYNDYRSFHRSNNPTWDTKVSQNRDWGLVDGYGNIKRAYHTIRKEHAPFKAMIVSDKKDVHEVKLLPRAKLDLPAFTLRQYQLTCEELNANNEWVNCAGIILPDVKPGDSAFVQTVIPVNKAALARRFSVSTPTGYAQMDTVIFYRAPEKPVIKFVENNGDKIRVQFEPAALATSYKLVYGEKEMNITTPETIDLYIETDRLSKESTIGKAYSVKLVAVNAYGETASDVISEKIVKSGVFPPIVKGFRFFMGGLSIGYASDPNEYLYKVQYSTSPDFSTDTQIIQTSNKGACFVPDLKADMNYYFRICTVHQYEVQSDWGMTYSVKALAPIGELNLNKALGKVEDYSIFENDSLFTWGSSPVKGDDGKYHLFYARWHKKYTFNAWVTHSEVAHAVSDNPLGPYRFSDVTLPARGPAYWDGHYTHNPTIHRFNGRYYLYYAGNFGDGVNVKNGLNMSHRNNQRIGVAVADSPYGPWTRSDKPLIDVSPEPDAHDALMVANPSVTRMHDGRYLMVYKAVAKRKPMPFGGPVVHLCAVAERPEGPFVKMNKPVFTIEGSFFPAEDPYIWYQDNCYYAITKDMHGEFTKKGRSLALFYSVSGFDWQPAKNVLVSTLDFTMKNGKKVVLSHMERPQLLIEKGVPRALFLACDSLENGAVKHTFNVHIPLTFK